MFEGELADRGQVIRVVLKRVKPRVEGAREMMEMEHMLNAHVAVAAPSACAQFLGYMKVEAQATRGEITQVTPPFSPSPLFPGLGLLPFPFPPP